jgi:hypothetical protein
MITMKEQKLGGGFRIGTLASGTARTEKIRRCN